MIICSVYRNIVLSNSILDQQSHLRAQGIYQGGLVPDSEITPKYPSKYVHITSTS